MKSQYEAIAADYARIQGERIGRQFIYEPSFFRILGDVSGKAVVDLGCGDGRSTRQIVQRGARFAAGLDNCEEMLRLALEETQRRVDYRKFCFGKADLTKKQDFRYFALGNGLNSWIVDARMNFDIAAGMFIFHYARTPNDLENMFANTAQLLKRKGRVVAMNNNPLNPLTENQKYSAVSRLVNPSEGLKEGSPIKITIYDKGKEAISFTTYHWSRSTYERAMKKAGFKDVKFHDMQVTEEGIKQFGKDFWKDGYTNPYLVVLEATKA